MSAGPVQTLRLAAGAARRALIGDLAFAAGRGLSLGCSAGLLLVGAAKLGATLPQWPILLGVSAGVGLLAAAAWAIARRWSPMRAAEEIDERLGIKDRLSTAIAMSGSTDPFSHWAIADAERAAPTVKLDRAIPLRLDWSWSVWPLVTAGAIAVALFVPVRAIARHPLRPEPTQAERAQTAAQLRQTADAIRQGLPENKVQGATAQQLKALEQLQNELSQGQVDPEQAAVKAAKQIEDLAKRLESDAAADQKASDAMREQLAQAAADAPGKPESERASPLMDAIQRGDIKTAAESASAAAENEQKMTAQEREQLARDLDQLAQALETAKESPATNGQLPEAPTGEDKPPAGDKKPGEPPESGSNPSEPKPGDPAPPKPPSDPAHPDQTDADKPSEPPPTPASNEREREQRENLSKDLRDAAKELREQPKPPTPSSNESQKQDQSVAREQKPQTKPGQDEPKSDKSDKSDQPGGQVAPTGDQKGDQSPQQGPKEGQKPEGDQKQDQPTGQKTEPGQPTSDKPPQGQPGATGETQGQKDASKPEPKAGDEKSKGQPQEPPEGAKPQGEQPGSTGATGATGSESRPDGKKPSGQSPQGQPQAIPQASPSPTGDPKGNAPETGEKSPEGSGLQKVARDLKRLQDGSGQPDQEKAKQLREMARKMLEQATPEQREQYRKLAEDFARQHPEAGDGGPGSESSPLTFRKPRSPSDPQTTPIDARRPATVSGNEKPPERTISEWYSDKPIDRNQPPGVPAPAEAMRQAADGAERAIENQQVPGRYQDLVRRVFRRYSEQAPPK